MKITNVERWLLQILFLLAAAIAALQTTGHTNVSSILFFLTFPLTVVLWLRTVRQRITGNDIGLMLTLLCAVCCVLMDRIRFGGRPSLDYWKKLVMFSMTLLFFQSAHRLQADAGLKRFVTAVTLALLLVFSLQFALPFLHTRDGSLLHLSIPRSKIPREIFLLPSA